MLVLNRRPGEVVVVDGPARIIVRQVRAKTVELGIEAPPTTRVTREEETR